MHSYRTRLGSSLAAITLAFVSLGLFAPGAHAGEDDPAPPAPGEQINNATVTISGGDARALAVCKNAATERGRGNVSQRNRCKNVATAVGGDVRLKNVDIVIDQFNDDASGTTSTQVNNAVVDISGGDATALAACVNLASEDGKGSVRQKNTCKNASYARGGDVVLKNVTITVIQTNTA